MSLTIREVTNKKMSKAFLKLPAKIHFNHPNWVPPIYLDEQDFFNPKKNKAFLHCDTIMALAYNEGQVVGRIMGIINHEYNTTHGDNDVRFAFIETWNDQEVFHALIEFIADWGKQKGMKKIVGPLGFSDKDPQGFLFEGFDEISAIATNCSFKYMLDLVQNEGFTKKVDLVVYKIDVPDDEPPVYKKIHERFDKQKYNLRVLEFTSRRKVKPFVRPVLNLVNQTFTGIYGFWPFTEEEMDDFANRYLYLINPRFIKVVVNENNDPVAFVIGMSDISKGIQKAKGKLIPFGFIHVLLSGKRSNQLNLLLGAIHPDFQGKGLDVMMGIKMLKSARELGKTTIDSHLELENNTKVRSEMERVGGKVYKRFRIFEKTI